MVQVVPSLQSKGILTVLSEGPINKHTVVGRGYA